MADDCDAPHETEIRVSDETTLSDFISILHKIKYIPIISGGKATWVLEHQYKPLAVIAMQWDVPKYFVDDNTRISDLMQDSSSQLFYLQYHLQTDPYAVFNGLRNCQDTRGRRW